MTIKPTAMKMLTQLSIAALLFIPTILKAAEPTWTGKAAPKPTPEVTAGCLPPSAATELDINNTRTVILSGGDMWWDLNSAQYEIPKGSGRNSLFAGALWMGGKDVSGQLKVAANTFRSTGVDFWTGPLSTVTSEITAETCAEFDRHYATFRDQVATFVAWYSAGKFDAENNTTTQQEQFPNYSIPDTILNWPAHGRNFPPFNEDYNLAPFIDRNGDNVYNPLDGDYPAYDLNNEADCSDRNIVNLYGDQNLWWVFNDKGDIHTNTGSQSIGLEVRAQAFGFATNDEVNNMTFYNYEIINRSTFTLTDTYFGQWVDPDLGGALDDKVGCDVQRGLGYCYNGDNDDQDNGGAFGYGENPPAIGVDFFQGPFQDNDGIDNPLTTNIPDAIAQKGIPYKGIGIGYGDEEVDNERFGMRYFFYYNNSGQTTGDPTTGVEYYNYLSGFWKDGSPMYYGGNGHVLGGGDPNTPADYMYPGDSDPLGWGTGGNVQQPWEEADEDDKRFVQSAGPFTLAPGAKNFITTGVVWARASSGGPLASVEVMRRADDKTQALFDNCFKLLSSPDAPDVSIQELDKELILYLSNAPTSNNYKESYEELSPFVFPPDTINGTPLSETEKEEFRKYKFQGYMLYQVKDNSVSASDLDNPDLARLVGQCDVKDGVSQIVNLYFDSDLGQSVPVEEVKGSDKGIAHSFKITEDEFATGNKTLVNHKQYYFIAIAYAHNAAGKLTPSEPFSIVQEPFLGSRKSAIGAIRVTAGIPHKTEVETNGTTLNSQYGDEVEITRLEGYGNGGNFIELKKESIDAIMEAESNFSAELSYEKGASPFTVKVIDPLNVKGGDFTLAFNDTTTIGNINDASWMLYLNGSEDTIFSDQTISFRNEQLALDWGLSVTIEQVSQPKQLVLLNDEYDDFTFYDSRVKLEDPSKDWLGWIGDDDSRAELNWIRSGTVKAGTNQDPTDDDYYVTHTFTNKPDVDVFADPDEKMETFVNGGWAPFALASYHDHGPMPDDPARNILFSSLLEHNALNYLHSVDVVITKDKSKWTRCAVIEMQDNPALVNGVYKGRAKPSPSLDKEGNAADTTGGGTISSNPDAANYISPTGMSWFPGYAIDIETGERLNMAFGEDSWLEAENGNDMLWNPTSNILEGVFNQDVRLGGKHYVFVFRNNVAEDTIPEPNSPYQQLFKEENQMPAYDAGEFMMDKLNQLGIGKANSILQKQLAQYVYRAAMWVGLPLLNTQHSLFETDVTVQLRVQTPFTNYGTGEKLSFGESLIVGESYYVNRGLVEHGNTIYSKGDYFTAVSNSFDCPGTDSTDVLIETKNKSLPLYTFNTEDLAPVFDSLAVAQDALSLINIVPNPYYAYSEYETDKLDNRVKIINLPDHCTVTIYTANGTIVRRYSKDDPTITSLDWDLKNSARIPIASGMYIIHVDAPGIGERVLKWFGAMRPVDLDSF